MRHQSSALLILLTTLILALYGCSSGGGNDDDDDSGSDTSLAQDTTMETNTSTSTDTDSQYDLATGQTQYTSLCASCHGSNGEGGIGSELTGCAQCSSFENLSAYIDSNMPNTNAASCVDECADNTAGYILETFQ